MPNIANFVHVFSRLDLYFSLFLFDQLMVNKHRVAPLEVFYNGKPLRLAQWPNEVCDLYYSLFYCYCIALFTGRAWLENLLILYLFSVELNIGCNLNKTQYIQKGIHKHCWASWRLKRHHVPLQLVCPCLLGTRTRPLGLWLLVRNVSIGEYQVKPKLEL